MDELHVFLHLTVAGIIALFAPVNPVGTALVVNPFFEHLDEKGRHRAASKVTSYCLILCLTVVFAGSWFFKLFGISLPVVQLAGGIVICHMGWLLLSSDQSASDSSATQSTTQSHGDFEDKLFYPIAFPMTTGPGTIAVLLTLSANAHATRESTYLANLGALVVAVLITGLMVYLSLAYTPTFLKRIGPRGGMVLNRISAFLVFCVGLQIATDGIHNLITQS
ncbi:MAG TPA: MarC family protein [Gammaproteobacteria bacterium]|jgi:multiple antibiotic resistance protein|nr:MarC family protein [Gammaproteobacteria bacterium]